MKFLQGTKQSLLQGILNMLQSSVIRTFSTGKIVLSVGQTFKSFKDSEHAIYLFVRKLTVRTYAKYWK